MSKEKIIYYFHDRDAGITRRFISCHVMVGFTRRFIRFHVMSVTPEGLLLAT